MITRRVGPLTAAVLALLAWTTSHTACRRGASGDRPAAQGPAASLTPHPSPSPAQRSRPTPPVPQTCWDRARTAEERDACAEAEYKTADAELNSVYQRVLAEAEPGLASAIRSAERAWLRYRDAYLASLSAVASRAKSPATVDSCRPIVRAWITRGRVTELARMLARGDRSSPADEAACDGTPQECTQAEQWVEELHRRVTGDSPPAGRQRLRVSQDAWLSYLAAQTAAVLAWQRPSDPSLRQRLREPVRVRLTLDRMGHVAMVDAYRQDVEERCQRLHMEAKMLAEDEARCATGEAASCTSLGDALHWGWYSIDRDRPRARVLYQKGCDLGSGAACASLAAAVRGGWGVARDPARAVRLLQRGCDAGDAANCQGLARAHAVGDGVPKDAARALVLWQRACDRSHSDNRTYWGDGHPCQTLARALESGDPVPADPGRALALHEDACERKLTDSCVAAARLVRKQSGFDARRVVSLYSKGCAGYRNAPACAELGDLYRDGNGFPKDRQAALDWYRSACSQGFVPGCREVSEMTGAPMGDPDDPVPDPGYIRTVRFVAAEQAPPLRLRLFGDDFGTVVRMQVFDEGPHRVTQEIALPKTPGDEPGGTLPLGRVDLNFDGYKDLTLQHFAGANNRGDFVWIFDPARRLFAYCPELSDRPNLEPDPKRRVVTSYYHFSASEGAASQYEWIQGRPLLVRAESRQRVEKEGINCLEHVTSERIRGRLVETQRSCQPE